MNFASLSFLAFFAFLFVLYYLLPRSFQWQLILIGSLFFYYFSGWQGLVYIAAVGLSTWLAARKIENISASANEYLKAHRAEMEKEERKSFKAKTKSRKRTLLVLCLVFNFGLLAVVKYTGFVLGIFGLSFSGIAVPLGISFYCFQATGYVIDVYWNKAKAQKNFFKYFTFVSFFPQLIQGPISRYNDLAPSMFAEHVFDPKGIGYGLIRVLWGLAKKLIVADRMAAAIKILISNPESYRGMYVLCLVFFYACQLYADFTGGIDMTIGMAKMLGIDVTENFERPFFSKNTAEYWRRWHITMGTWFRDYVFYPLSVSQWMMKFHQFCRKKFGDGIGKRMSVFLSTILLWAVTGIWHGASWNYLVWGLLNGIVIIISQLLEPFYEKFHARFPGLKDKKAYTLFQILRTFVLMSFIRILDVYRDVPLTFRQLGTIFTVPNISVLFDGSLLNIGLGIADYVILIAGLIAMVAVSLQSRQTRLAERISAKGANAVLGCCVLLALLTLLFGIYGFGYDASSFIYNQF